MKPSQVGFGNSMETESVWGHDGKTVEGFEGMASVENESVTRETVFGFCWGTLRKNLTFFFSESGKGVGMASNCAKEECFIP